MVSSFLCHAFYRFLIVLFSATIVAQTAPSKNPFGPFLQAKGVPSSFFDRQNALFWIFHILFQIRGKFKRFCIFRPFAAQKLPIYRQFQAFKIRRVLSLVFKTIYRRDLLCKKCTALAFRSGALFQVGSFTGRSFRS
jgi:hypothetical protein